MRRTTIVLPVVIVLSTALGGPVLAGAPAEGVVVEGVGVPGAALGDTREQVEASYGQPNWCQDEELGGDQAVCRFPVDGGGGVTLRFRGPDGLYARNAPDDVLYHVNYGSAELDWTTTAGISPALALADRQAVVDAYPDAGVSYDAAGAIERVEDQQLGIRITWIRSPYTNGISVAFVIFAPRPPAAEGELAMRVSQLDLTATKHRGQRHILAVLRVLDERGLPVPDATVSITWTYPWGATNTDIYNNFTTETGYEFFERADAQRGTWTFTINDVALDGYLLDREASLLSANVTVR